jgi:hypothetical protein
VIEFNRILKRVREGAVLETLQILKASDNFRHFIKYSTLHTRPQKTFNFGGFVKESRNVLLEGIKNAGRGWYKRSGCGSNHFSWPRHYVRYFLEGLIYYNLIC